MSKKRAKLAEAGDVEALMAEFKSTPRGQYEMYQWLEVAGDFGSNEADKMADVLLETEFSHVSEALAVVHFEIGEWWALGENQLPVNAEHALHHFKYAATVGRNELKVQAKQLRPKLSGSLLTKFNKLFKPSR